MKTTEIKEFTTPIHFNNGKITGRKITDGILSGYTISIFEENGKPMCHIFNPNYKESESFGIIINYSDHMYEGAIVNTFVNLIAQDIAKYCMEMTSLIFFKQCKAQRITKDNLPKKLLNFPNTFHMFEAQNIINKTVELIDKLRDEKYGSGHNLIMETILKNTKNDVLSAYKESVADLTVNEIKIPKLKIENDKNATKPNDGRGGLGDN